MKKLEAEVAIRSGLLTALLSFSAVAWSQSDPPKEQQTPDVPYIDIQLCDYEPYRNPGEYWNDKRTFCFTKEGKQEVYRLSTMGDIKLRENDKWANEKYKAALSKENQEIVGQYETYYVSFLSLDNPTNGVTPFVAEVVFSYVSYGPQTILVFGEASESGIKITGYSSLNRQGKYVERYIRHLFAGVADAFRLKNPFNGDHLVNNERVRSVLDVVKQFENEHPGQSGVEPNKP